MYRGSPSPGAVRGFALYALAITVAVLAQLATFLPLSLADSQLFAGEELEGVDLVDACGYFSYDHPQDPGVPHQPCYGFDGTVQFCCTGGSTKCSCPVHLSSFECYNYESDNTLNAVTGEECGFFLPSEAPKSVTLGRNLAVSPCNNNALCPNMCGPYNLTSTEIIDDYNDIQCTYDDDQAGCNYNRFTGSRSVDPYVSYESGCCPTQAIC